MGLPPRWKWSSVVADGSRRVYWLTAVCCALAIPCASAWATPVGDYVALPLIPVEAGPTGIALSDDLDRLYVTNQLADSVSVIDATTNTVVATIPVGQSQPARIAVSDELQRAYVANFYSASVSVLDLTTNTFSAPILVGDGPAGIGVNATTGKVYVSQEGASPVYSGRSVTVLDATTGALVTSIPVPSTPGALVVDPILNRVYVSFPFAAEVLVIDGSTDTVVDAYPVGNGPSDLALNVLTHQLFVPNYLDNTVSILDTVTGTLLQTLVIPNGTTTQAVAVDPIAHTLFVALGNIAADNLRIYDLDTYTQAQSLTTGTILGAPVFDAATNTVYLSGSGASPFVAPFAGPPPLAPVPEPSTLLVTVSGFATWGALALRRRRSGRDT